MGTDEKTIEITYWGPIKNKPIQVGRGDHNFTHKCRIYIIGRWGCRLGGATLKISGDNWQDLGEVVGPINDGKEFDADRPAYLPIPMVKMQVALWPEQDQKVIFSELGPRIKQDLVVKNDAYRTSKPYSGEAMPWALKEITGS